jgi:hypothetical protein
MTPKWVVDNAFITRFLNFFVDQCDKPKTVRFQKSINSKVTPELFDFKNEDTEYLWRLIDLKLNQQHNVIERIQYRRVGESSAIYENAIVYFNRKSENLVRSWLQRSAEQSYALQWHDALNTFPQLRSTSLNQSIKVKGLSAIEIIEGFARVGQTLLSLSNRSEEISLRGLSARCFWGDSKFLDNRRDLIKQVFELSESVVVPRRIMLSAYVPLNLSELIFVENFDSFLSTVNAVKLSPRSKSTAVVYSAGYRGSAQLIRTHGHSQFVTINSVDDAVFNAFSEWWFQQSELQVKTYFWGDLDYEGMRILKALDKNFPNTQAWKIAYDMMLTYHKNGLGHGPQIANKQYQLEPEESGCEYADTKLIPLLLSSQRFIDQEVISQAQLQRALNLTY